MIHNGYGHRSNHLLNKISKILNLKVYKYFVENVKTKKENNGFIYQSIKITQ